MTRIWILAVVGVATGVLLSHRTTAEDWPMFGRDGSRNAVSPERAGPIDWDVGEFNYATRQWEGSRNVRWVAELGSESFGDPVVVDGQLWVGTNNADMLGNNALDASVLAAFAATDGSSLYRYLSPRLPKARVHDWPYSAMACSPLIEGDRMWFTTNRCETVCLDLGPLKRDGAEPRELWKVDMMKQFGVFPRRSEMMWFHSCSIAAHEDRIYVITGNGADYSGSNVPAPLAPSLICLNKESGQLVWQDNSPGASILEGQWASPLVVDVGDRTQVVVPQGDGWVRSFDAANGQLIWKFDINFKTSEWRYGRSSTRNAILATPVLYQGRIYLASGRNISHGEGPGRLVCLDPNRTGDISSELAIDTAGQPVQADRYRAVDPDQDQRAVPNPNSGLIWEYTQFDRNGNGKIEFEEEFHRTSANVAIKDDLLVVGDQSGLVHCVDARTGTAHWTHDMMAVIQASPLIVGDRIYIADEDGDVSIFGLSADPSRAMRQAAGAYGPLAEINMGHSINCSPIFADGTLYIATNSWLFAIQEPAGKSVGHWPQWRGPTRDNHSSDGGLLKEWPPGGPPLRWRAHGIGQGIASVALADGRLYTIGSAGKNEQVVALDESTGELNWQAAIGPAIDDAPLMRWLSQRAPTIDADRLYVTTAEADLICLRTSDGTELWRRNYKTEFGSLPRVFGFVDYPLVDGDHLICTPGGTKATLAALNKATGEVVWQCLLDPAEAGSYAALLPVETRGLRYYVAVLYDSIVGVRASDGKLLWRQASPRIGYVTSLTTLVKDSYIIVPGAFRRSDLVVLEAQRQQDDVTVREIRRLASPLDYFLDSTVRVGSHLFTFTRGGLPLCIDWRKGETVWGPLRIDGGGMIAMTSADRRLYLVRADGTVLLADASPESFQLRGKFRLPDHQQAIGATLPVVTGGRLYIRDNDHLFCYDVRENSLPVEARIVELGESVSRAAPTVSARERAKNKQPDAIFVPTPHDVVAKMLELAAVKKSDLVYDLGSGDGRIVIAAAKSYGARCVGIELDKQLVVSSRENIQKAALAALVRIDHADMFQQDLKDADVVALYLPPQLMDRLLPQFDKLKPGTRIVSHYFKFTDIEPATSVQFESSDDGDVHDIHLWTVPLRKAAR